jgi:hypothetical protein
MAAGVGWSQRSPSIATEHPPSEQPETGLATCSAVLPEIPLAFLMIKRLVRCEIPAPAVIMSNRVSHVGV